ncbi:MAG: acylphosphatase [Planctomycetota bacterium]|nr:acylphosphatase [Planctomycetota bacterium]
MTAVSRVAFMVRGRVQGVGFRWFTASAARALQLCGHVRNEPDGAVRGEVEGLATSVADFLAQVSIGPKLAKVDEVVVQPIVACGGETFTIEQ